MVMTLAYMKMVKYVMTLSRKLHVWTGALLTIILLITLLVSVATGEDTFQSTLPPSHVLFGAGARWAARNGTTALYVNWKDNWAAHHLTDGANWEWFSESARDNYNSWVKIALEHSGFEVTLAGDIPNNLDDYDLVVIFAAYAVEPRHEPLIRNYVFNGGSVVLFAGDPCYLTTYSKSLSVNTDLTPIQEWFGCSSYVNAGGIASPAFDNPFGSSLTTSDILIKTEIPWCGGAASLDEDSQPIAFWSSGPVAAFTHEYGDGRVYWQSTIAIDYQTSDSTQPTDSSAMSTSISISTDVPSSFVGFAVDVYGTLNDTFGNSLANKTVLLYYTFPGYDSWIPATSDATDELGRYDINWIPSATGSFTLKAEWRGNATHSGSSATLSLSIVPYRDERVFSVESNSTVSAFAFNSTSLELSFSVSGSDGTMGYVKLTVGKSVAADVGDIKVILDGKEMVYSVSSSGDSWLLIFTYAHSTHDVAINFSVQSEPESEPAPTTFVVTASAMLLAVVGLGLIVYFKKRKR
jgi:hypothetical protein